MNVSPLMPIRVKYPTFEGHFFIFSWAKQIKNQSFCTKKLINTKVKKIGLKLYFLCQNRLTFLIRNKNVIKTNGYSIISQRILDKKILIFCSKNSNFVIQNLNLVEISGLSINSFQTFAKNHSISKTILLTLADIMHVKSMQYC